MRKPSSSGTGREQPGELAAGVFERDGVAVEFGYETEIVQERRDVEKLRVMVHVVASRVRRGPDVGPDAVMEQGRRIEVGRGDER